MHVRYQRALHIMALCILEKKNSRLKPIMDVSERRKTAVDWHYAVTEKAVDLQLLHFQITPNKSSALSIIFDKENRYVISTY